MKYKILVAEDDTDIADFIKLYLENEGYEVIPSADGMTAYEKLKESRADLAVVDIMMPKLNGYDLIRRIREDSNIPIIILSAKNLDSDKILGLDLGADDYLTKPFGVMELISRVKALLRRSKSIQEDQILRLKNVTLDSEKRIVHVNDIPCELTFKEFELLKLLMINAGIVLRREVIMMDVWGTDYEGESRTLDMHIKTLRQKLGDAGNMIKTVRNVGYKME